jgi:antitoxin (DNA-binding transcriptional repressor) of toxin-antitoxin stability system
MFKIGVEDVADQLQTLLERVAKGEEVILVEQDREVARLVPPPKRDQWLTRTRQFREALQIQGESLSTTVIRARQEDRD